MRTVDYSDQTTVVTGASSGIGAAFARELARRGSDLVLVARRLDRLEELAAGLETDHGIAAIPIALDLSAPRAGRALAAELAERGIEVTGLVNNAGFATDDPFHREDPERLLKEINVDIANLVDLTRAFIEPLRRSGSGVLVNVASMAAYTPFPGMAVYSAAKAFVLNFTEALWLESRGTGMRVLALSPGLTRTEFFDELATGAYSGNYQTPEQVVRTAMRALDRGRSPSVQSGRLNRFASLLPRFLTRRRTVILSGAISARSRGGEDVAAALCSGAVDQRQEVGEVGPLARGHDLSGRHRLGEVEAACGQFHEHDRTAFDDVRRRPAAVPRALHALDRAVRRHPHLHRVTGRLLGQRLEQLAHRGLERRPVRLLAIVERGDGVDHSVHNISSRTG